MDDIKQKVSDYLKNHFYTNLATVDKEGKPVVSTVAYASDNAIMYFVTDNSTRKALNILSNPAVAYTVDEDKTDWNEIQGVQATGKATILKDKTEIDKALKLLIEKYPPMANMELSPSMCVVKIIPGEVLFHDYTVSFGHNDKVKYCRGK